MAQSFCNQCGGRLDAAANCENVSCVRYAPPQQVAAAVAPPPGLDLFAEPALREPPPTAEPQILPPPPAAGRDWVTAGDAGQNDVYVGNRLLFRDPETTLNGSPELKLLLMAAARWLAIGLIVFPAIFVV